MAAIILTNPSACLPPVTLARLPASFCPDGPAAYVDGYVSPKSGGPPSQLLLRLAPPPPDADSSMQSDRMVCEQFSVSLSASRGCLKHVGSTSIPTLFRSTWQRQGCCARSHERQILCHRQTKHSHKPFRELDRIRCWMCVDAPVTPVQICWNQTLCRSAGIRLKIRAERRAVIASASVHQMNRYHSAITELAPHTVYRETTTITGRLYAAFAICAR